MLINFDYLKNKYSLDIKGIMHIGAHQCEELNAYLNLGLQIEDIIWIEANSDIYLD